MGVVLWRRRRRKEEEGGFGGESSEEASKFLDAEGGVEGLLRPPSLPLFLSLVFFFTFSFFFGREK
jgi:hypothetical protein